MTGDAYACPIGDCDYTAPLPGSVKGHVSRKTTDGHEGESGPEYSEDALLQADEHPDYGGDPAESDDAGSDDVDTVTDAGDDGDSDDGTDTAETDTTPPDSDPSPDGGEGIVPEGESVSTVSHGAENPECPGCGETESVQAAPAYANAASDQLDSEHVELLESSDYVCGECGGVWDE